jgi:hypothetical protein
MTITASDASAIDHVRARAAEILALDRWPRERLLELQRSRLRSVLQHAVDQSPYYRETLGADAADRDLSELPTLPKQIVTERFDQLVTDPRVQLDSVRRFLETASRVRSSSASSGCSRRRARPGRQGCRCTPEPSLRNGLLRAWRVSRGSASGPTRV